MSDKNKNNADKVKIIPSKNIVDIKVSGAFYARLQQLVIHWTSLKTQEELKIALNNISKESGPTNEYEYHLFTLVSIIGALEEEADKQNKTEWADPIIT